jgi:3-dehydroquinate synthase
MARDKQASAGRIPFILTRGIGKAFVDRSVELGEVQDFLEREMAR